MPSKRSYSTGSITKLPNGKYLARFRTPTSRPSKTVNTMREAKSWLAQIKHECDMGEYVEPSQMSLAAWWDRWVKIYKSVSVSKASLALYAATRKRLEQRTSLLKRPLADIRPSDIQEALNALQGLSDRTREITLIHLRLCLKQAVSDGLIRTNPTAAIKPPRTDKGASKGMDVLSDAEYARVLAEVTRPPRMTAKGTPDKHDLQAAVYRDVILFCLQTGVRRGEACALVWDDINGMTATISKSMDPDRVTGPTKTRQARTVPLTTDIRKMLDRRKFYGGDLVFTTSTGAPVCPRNVLRTMKAITPHSIHSLRHTYITRAARKGVNPKVLQSITGHKTLAVILGVYTHVSEDDKKQANALINEIGQ